VAAHHLHQQQPQQSQAAVLEAVGVARGLASAECFEQYSAKLGAPPLVGEEGKKVDDGSDAATSVLSRHLSSSSSSLASSSSASNNSLSPDSSASAAALASCLVTPITEEENAGEAAREQLRRSAEETEAEVEMRFAREISTREALTPAGVNASSSSATASRFSAEVAPAPGSGARGNGGASSSSSRRRGSRGGAGNSNADPLSMLLIALGAPAPPEVVSRINRGDVEIQGKRGGEKEEGKEKEELASTSPSLPLAADDEGPENDNQQQQPLFPPRVESLPPALDNEKPETMASLAQLAMALEAVHASAAANTLSLDEDDFFAEATATTETTTAMTTVAGAGGRKVAPLAVASLSPLGTGLLATDCTLRSNDFDDGRGIEEAESEDEREEVLRFLRAKRSVVGVVSSDRNGKSSSSSAAAAPSVISSAMLVAAASGAAPSPWLTLEEEEEALAAAAAGGGERREPVGV